MTYVAGSETADQTLDGTTGTWARSAAAWLSGVLSLKTIVLPEAVTDCSTCQTPLVSSAGFFLRMPKVVSTSAAVTGVPLDQVTPDRRVKSTWVALTMSCPVARNGV